MPSLSKIYPMLKKKNVYPRSRSIKIVWKPNAEGPSRAGAQGYSFLVGKK